MQPYHLSTGDFLTLHLLALAALSLLLLSAAPPPDPAALFAAGDFPAALASARDVLKTEPTNPSAALVAGTVELYENHLREARVDLESIGSGAPEIARARRELAEVTRREQTTLHPDATFTSATASVPFVTTDPLPSVAVTVNGQRAVFQIDTGAPGITVDEDFAQRAHLPIAPGTHIGIFPGGRSEIKQVRIASFGLGNAMLTDIAGDVLPISRMMPGPHPVDGVIGTAIFERFAGVTIDYAGGRLMLYAAGSRVEAANAESVAPLWLVGDHFLVTRGAIADVDGLVLLDTGLVGGGVSPSKSVVDRAHLTMGASDEGLSANGGRVGLQHVVVPTVRIGDSVEHDVAGFFQPGPSPLDIFPFSLVGVVSHDYFRHRALTIDFTTMHVTIARRTG